ncbi:MAG: FecR family protein [Deltaproteobacteria bacterium]|nr:FecR family protein [Deltaproteobacteria bacterium]
MKTNTKGFTLVELIVVIVIIGILSGAAYIGIQKVKSKSMNDKVLDDLVAISNALEQYKRDHFNKYPVPQTRDENPDANMNINCFYADATYAHDCAAASFRQSMIDNNLLTKRYLQEVPTDPRTGSRYVYGVSNDGWYFQVAGIVEESDGTWKAMSVSNLGKGFPLPSIIRAYNGPNFVVDGGTNLPYSPDYLAISAALENVNGMVLVNGGSKAARETLYPGDTVETGDDGTVDIYFSDGSISRLDPGSEFTILGDGESTVQENDKDNIITRIRLKLFSGKIWSKVARLASKSEFSVETTSAIAGVRGTEFGVWADGNIILVRSGSVWVGEETEANTVSATDVPMKAVMTATGPTAVETVTEPDLLEYIEEHNKSTGFSAGLSEMDVPFIVGALFRPSGTYDVYVSFGAPYIEDIYSFIDGFEIYSGAWTEKFKVMKEGWEDNPTHEVTGDDITYDTVNKVYVFPLDYTESGSVWDAEKGRPETILVRAFVEDDAGERTYSALSWPPIGFLAVPPAADQPWSYADIYKEFASLESLVPPTTECTFGTEGTQPCTIAHGTGTQKRVCTADGVWPTSWSTCGLTGCDAGYELVGGTCEPAGPTLEGLCNAGTDTWFDATNDECWVMGAAGATCTDACNAVDGSAVNIGIDCDTGSWNDTSTCSICGQFGVTVAGCISGTSDTSPKYQLSGLYANNCFYRSSGVSSCAATIPTTLKRICKCILMP